MERAAFISFLDHKEATEAFIKKFKGIKIFKGLKKSFIKKPSLFVIIIEPSNLDKLINIKEDKNLLKFMKGILIKEPTNKAPPIHHLLRELKLSHFSKYLLDFSNLKVLERVLWAWSVQSQNDLIADARIVGDKIFIQTCDFKNLFIPKDNIKALSKLNDRELQNFVIDKHGSYIHWEIGDIHLDLESFKTAIDPDLRARLKEKRMTYNKLYGEAIREIRKEYHLNQDELGISDKQIRRYEKGDQRPTFKAYKLIAKAHGLAVSDYLDHLSNKYQSLLKN